MRGAAKGLGIVTLGIALGAPLHAQQFPIDPNARERLDQPDSQGEGLRDIGNTADAGAGDVGQRQTREDAAPNINPIGRINSRVENRVQNRIRNRIDRDYDPTANATAPFRRAEDEAREAQAPPPRER